MKPDVLIVDDEEDFSSALAERLVLRGIAATAASDGEEALARLDARPPRVVVLDLMMPGLSGLEVLKKIKSLKPSIQVIILTGAGSTKQGLEAMHLGAFDYLMKPVALDELLQKISDAIRTGKEKI